MQAFGVPRLLGWRNDVWKQLAIFAGIFALGIIVAPVAIFAAPCARHDGTAMRDEHWRHAAHPLVGQVLEGDRPIAVEAGSCERTPFQQLIVEVWNTIRAGGIVLLGEVHDNPEHHKARGDILWPRLGQVLKTGELRPAAVLEHIRTSQRAQVDEFYRKAARSRRLWRAPDLLRVLDWKASGWPEAQIFYPLFDAALWARMPIIPGNAVRERMRTLVRSDASPSVEEEARLRLARGLPQSLVDALDTELAGSHCGVLPASAIPSMSLAQRYTDAHLADVLVQAADKHGGAFLLAGNGHVRTDRGVPWYLHQLAPQRKVLSVMLLEVADGRTGAAEYVPKGPDGAPAADYVLFTPRHARPDPCEAMQRKTP
jgi:uncharacterized iron-regulated protein